MILHIQFGFDQDSSFEEEDIWTCISILAKIAFKLSGFRDDNKKVKTSRRCRYWSKPMTTAHVILQFRQFKDEVIYQIVNTIFLNNFPGDFKAYLTLKFSDFFF